MAINKKQAIVLGSVLVLIGAVFALVSWSGGEDNIARQLQAEPELTVYINETGKTTKMKLEEYTAAVVAGEMFAGWPVEAYAAQAILVRSFTMDFKAAGGMREKHGADVSTSVEETQAFNPAAVTEAIKKGVEMTRGQVMTHGNRFVRAWFHAYSGGITAQAKEGLAYEGKEPPFTKSVKLPVSELIPEDARHWSVQYSIAELQSLLAQTGVQVGGLEQVEIMERGPTNRITKIRIVGDQGEQEISGPEFRLALGSTKMKSALVDEFEFSPEGLKIAGSGYGHGVGLSQWDAFRMAKEGQQPADIVTAFFQGIQIRKIYD